MKHTEKFYFFCGQINAIESPSPRGVTLNDTKDGKRFPLPALIGRKTLMGGGFVIGFGPLFSAVPRRTMAAFMSPEYLEKEKQLYESSWEDVRAFILGEMKPRGFFSPSLPSPSFLIPASRGVLNQAAFSLGRALGVSWASIH